MQDKIPKISQVPDGLQPIRAQKAILVAAGKNEADVAGSYL
jgi:hypothetical protein